MGATLCGTSAVAAYTEIQLKEISSAKPVFELLKIRPHGSIAVCFHSFFDHAVDNSSGEANVRRLCNKLQLTPDRFYTQSFLCFGNESSIKGSQNRWQKAARAEISRCTFSQYIVGLYNLCTLSKTPSGLGVWLYRMHFGNSPAHPDEIMEILDRRYGISEERDYHANVAKKWYGDNYHKNNETRTRSMIQRYVKRNPEKPDSFNKITMSGWLELVKRSPGILQTYIAGQLSLRRLVAGERFWRKMDKMKRESPEVFRSIDNFVLRIEEDFPGHLIQTDDAREFFNLDEMMAKKEALRMDIEKNAIEGELGVDYVSAGVPADHEPGKAKVQEDHSNWR